MVNHWTTVAGDDQLAQLVVPLEVGRQGRFDIVVVQYHHQGHIPIKLMGGFDDGVNVTVGPPFFRTSVDDGTSRTGSRAR